MHEVILVDQKNETQLKILNIFKYSTKATLIVNFYLYLILF